MQFKDNLAAGCSWCVAASQGWADPLLLLGDRRKFTEPWGYWTDLSSQVGKPCMLQAASFKLHAFLIKSPYLFKY